MVNGTLFFVTDDGSSGEELWTSDGTAGGTVQVRDIVPGTQGSTPSNLTDVAGMLFFSVRNGEGDGELWASDGTTAGTLRLRGGYPQRWITAPPPHVDPPKLEYFIAVGGRLFFAADDGINGTELWTSDGTPAGTFMVKDIGSGSLGSFPAELTNVNGTLFFRAYHDTSNTAWLSSLWKSDGTAAGTSLVYNLGQEGTTSFTSSNGKLFFIRQVNTGVLWVDNLWVSDGTGLGTVPIKKFEGMQVSVLDPTDFNGALYFFVINQSQAGPVMPTGLWRSDGTQAGTVPVYNPFIGGFWNITVVNNTMFLAASGTVGNYPLWKATAPPRARPRYQLRIRRYHHHRW